MKKFVTLECCALSISLIGLQDFGEHGRELVTVEVALRVLDLLADPSRVEVLTRSRGGNPEKMAALLERTVFKVSADSSFSLLRLLSEMVNLTFPSYHCFARHFLVCMRSKH